MVTNQFHEANPTEFNNLPNKELNFTFSHVLNIAAVVLE